MSDLILIILGGSVALSAVSLMVVNSAINGRSRDSRGRH